MLMLVMIMAIINAQEPIIPFNAILIMLREKLSWDLNQAL